MVTFSLIQVTPAFYIAEEKKKKWEEIKQQ